jgi:hypothetical protein
LVAFQVSGIFEICIYVFLLGMAFYNTYYFLCKQKRYRIYFISVFYGLAYVILLTRLATAIIQTDLAFDPNRFNNLGSDPIVF